MTTVFVKLVQMQTTAGREIVVELQVHGEEAVAKEESLLLLREGEIPKDFSGGSFIKSQQLLRCQHCQVILPCDYIIDAALVFTNHYSTLPDPLPEIIKLHASVKQSHLDLKFIIRDETGNSPPEVMMEFIDLQQFLFLDVIEVQRLPSHRPTPEEIVKHSRQRKRRRLGAMSGGFKIKSRRRLRKPWLKDWLWDLMKLLILTCFEQKKKKKKYYYY